jgi:AcrR family transcriptional regulator
MSRRKSMAVEEKERREAILAAAAQIIIRQGYNKMTMNDIADELGLSRPLIYLHFKSKDELLETLIAREMLNYGQSWLEHIEADPKGGTVASTYRSVIYALNKNPLMAAIVKRDEKTFGKYLRKKGNIFQSLQSPSMTRDFLQAMQEAGAVRKEINVGAMAYVLDAVSYSMVGSTDFPTNESDPSYDAIMETLAEMLDRMLTPPSGGNQEAGKAVLRKIADDARAYFEQVKQGKRI